MLGNCSKDYLNLAHFVSASVTRRKYYYSMYGHLQQWQFGQKHKNAKVGRKVCQIQNKLSKNLPKDIFCQFFSKSGHAGLCPPFYLFNRINYIIIYLFGWKKTDCFPSQLVSLAFFSLCNVNYRYLPWWLLSAYLSW